MKISCVQMNMRFCDPDENFRHAKELILKAAGDNPDVIVLPEMWNTGFFPEENLSELSDNNGERVKAEIASLARELHINIVAGSVANRKNNKVYNTAYVFDRDGNTALEYDKMHLFSPMGEDKFFEKGDEICRFRLDGKMCGVIICYDIRFPELTRMIAVDGVDFLFIVSQWPDVRIPQLLALARARAIENQIFTVCANSCGVAGETVFGGNSSVFDPYGEALAVAGEREQIITVSCNTDILSEIRSSINVFCDRRTEIYKVN